MNYNNNYYYDEYFLNPQVGPTPADTRPLGQTATSYRDAKLPPVAVQSSMLPHSMACRQLPQVTNICRILLFRTSLYLGAIFDGTTERSHMLETESYKSTVHRATLQIIDTFGPEIKARDGLHIPDLILICVPLASDQERRRREYATIRMMKRSFRNDIWRRAIITLTAPRSVGIEALTRRREKRKKSLDDFMTGLGIPVLPPTLCISEDLAGDLPGDPEKKWHTELWTTIFQSCSKEGRATLFTYLSDRLTDTPTPATRSPLLQKIPSEAVAVARSLMGEDYFEMTEKM